MDQELIKGRFKYDQNILVGFNVEPVPVLLESTLSPRYRASATDCGACWCHDPSVGELSVTQLLLISSRRPEEKLRAGPPGEGGANQRDDRSALSPPRGSSRSGGEVTTHDPVLSSTLTFSRAVALVLKWAGLKWRDRSEQHRGLNIGARPGSGPHQRAWNTETVL